MTSFAGGAFRLSPAERPERAAHRPEPLTASQRVAVAAAEAEAARQAVKRETPSSLEVSPPVHPYSAEGMAARLGRLIVACEALLQVVDDCPVALDPWHQAKVDRARKALEESSPAVTL